MWITRLYACMIWWWRWYKKHAYFILANPSLLLLIFNPYWHNSFLCYTFWCWDQDGEADTPQSEACNGYKSHVMRVFNKVDKFFSQELLNKLFVARLPIDIDQVTIKLKKCSNTLTTDLRIFIKDPEQPEHAILEAEDVQEVISNKIENINIFTELWKSLKKPKLYPSLVIPRWQIFKAKEILRWLNKTWISKPEHLQPCHNCYWSWTPFPSSWVLTGLWHNLLQFFQVYLDWVTQSGARILASRPPYLHHLQLEVLWPHRHLQLQALLWPMLASASHFIHWR